MMEVRRRATGASTLANHFAVLCCEVQVCWRCIVCIIWSIHIGNLHFDGRNMLSSPQATCCTVSTKRPVVFPLPCRLYVALSLDGGSRKHLTYRPTIRTASDVTMPAGKNLPELYTRMPIPMPSRTHSTAPTSPSTYTDCRNAVKVKDSKCARLC